MTSKHEQQEAEAFARDAQCRDLKEHYEQKGDTRRTGEQIEREVAEQQERTWRRRDHSIYEGDK